MSEIKWLHISDLHFDGCEGKDPYDLNKVLNPLLNTVEERHPDLIFVTGDIGKTGKQEDYDLAKLFFEDLFKIAKLEPKRFWLVPGNHDVEREAGKYQCSRTLDNERSSQEFFGNPEYREGNLKRFENYKKFLEDIFPGRKLADGDVTPRSAIVKIKNVPIGILPFNSAWLSQDDYDSGKLWIGVRAIRDRVEWLRSQSPPPELSIALLHHPFAYLHENETAKAWIQNDCPVILRGHLHQTDVEVVSSLSGLSIVIAAGATYQGSDKPCRAFFVTLDTKERKLRLEPLQYIEGPRAKTWVTDNSVFPDKPGFVGEYQLPLFPPDIPPSPPITFSNFPFDDWKAVNTFGWLEGIVEWFEQAYERDPENAMKKLLDHVFEIINNAPPNLYQLVMNLGETLIPCLPQDLEAKYQHHRATLELLKLGIHHNLPHLFMLPQVDKDNLLTIPNYSKLLLSARHFAAGRYKEAQELARQIVPGCYIANYIVGHSARKRERLEEAKLWLEENRKLLQKFEQHVCSCRKEMEVICNESLLQAENFRALGVVYRRLGEKEKAEKYFREATKSAKSALLTIKERASDQTPLTSNAVISAAYDKTPRRVVADVYYSHGYYLFEEKDYRKAEKLFERSISALKELGEEDWDAPYMRLAIIKLRSNQIDESKDLFLKARRICEDTTPTKNRESSLGLALCTLGLKNIESVTKMPLTEFSPMEDLEKALQLQPPLSQGPLVCHLNDAKIFIEMSISTPTIVSDFINRLEKELQESYK